MKQLKFLAALTLFLAFQIASAQERPTVKNWPQLASVVEVADRIESNIKSDNKSAFRFATTLNQQVEKMVKDGAPKAYQNSNVKQAMEHLQLATQAFASQAESKMSYDDLNAHYSKIKHLVNELALLGSK